MEIQLRAQEIEIRGNKTRGKPPQSSLRTPPLTPACLHHGKLPRVSPVSEGGSSYKKKGTLFQKCLNLSSCNFKSLLILPVSVEARKKTGKKMFSMNRFKLRQRRREKL